MGEVVLEGGLTPPWNRVMESVSLEVRGMCENTVSEEVGMRVESL